MNDYQLLLRVYSFLLILLICSSSFSIQAQTKEELKQDAVSIIKLIKKSSQPDLYRSEIKRGIEKYSQKIAEYSKEEASYISEICKLYIQLQIAVWDGFKTHFKNNGKVTGYNAKEVQEVKELIDSIEAYDIKLQREQDLPFATSKMRKARQTMSDDNFLKMLNKIRSMMQSDYLKTYNAIFQK